MVPAILRASRRLALAAAVALLAGCASFEVGNVLQTRPATAAIPMQEVLIVVDYRTDLTASRSSSRNAAAWMQTQYAQLGELMADAVRAAGGKPTVVLVGTTDDIQRPTAAHSHVWTQSISRLRTQENYGMVVRRYRTWTTQIAHRVAPGAPLSAAFSEQYLSDGIDCFLGAVNIANKAQCQANYRRFIQEQLARYTLARP